MANSFNPKVSIVIPVYNGANYVREAIDSALAQTYKNLEIVVVNDGSRDDGKTDEICRSYGDKIRYFPKENGGVATALNMGIEKMEGEYFSWLSHDDVYYPDKIEKQIEFLSKIPDRKKIILYANYDLIDEQSKLIQKMILDHENLIKKPEYALLRGSINGITLLIPKTAFKEHGNFDLELKCTQDYEMWRRMMRTYTFVHMDDIFTKTRIHPLQDSNKHPNVVTEGDPLWIGMMEDLSKKDKERLEGSEYNFYKEMVLFLEAGSPYTGAVEFAKKRMEEIYNNTKGKLNDIKVTVIIPFFNRIDPLLRSVESVQKQTHKNFELLLVNDGSTEDLSGLKEFIRGDDRIKIINLDKNYGGPAKARNAGIEKATGEYITFLDSDDEFLPTKIEVQLIQMYLTTYEVSHTSYIRRGKKKDKQVDIGKLTGVVIPEIIRSCQIATPTVMIRKEYLMKNKFRFNENFKIGEDTCFWLEILRNTKLLGIDQELTVVNVNANSAANNNEKHLEGLTNILSYLLSDKEYSIYHIYISNLCNRYVEVSKEIMSGDISEYQKIEKMESMNKFSKLFYLFKYQGIALTLKKIYWKYGRRLLNKIMRK